MDFEIVSVFPESPTAKTEAYCARFPILMLSELHLGQVHDKFTLIKA
jgi:hypothetical protein